MPKFPPPPTAFDPFGQFLELIPWVSLDGFSTGGSVGGSVTIGAPAVIIATASTLNNYYWLASMRYWYKLLEAGKLVTVEFIITVLDYVTSQNIWLRLDESPAVPPPESGAHLGWKIDGADLYASNADGATQTITDTGIDLTATPQNTRLKMVYNPGTDIKFYVDDVLKVTHTTNLPTPDWLALYFYVLTLVNADRNLWLDRVLIQKAHS